MSLSQDLSQDVKDYKFEEFFSSKSLQSGMRLHIGNSIFDQSLTLEKSGKEILNSKCWSESILKLQTKLNLQQQQFYIQKIQLSSIENRILHVECNCFMHSNRCKHTVASILNLLHKRRNNLPINDENNLLNENSKPSLNIISNQQNCSHNWSEDKENIDMNSLKELNPTDNLTSERFNNDIFLQSSNISLQTPSKKRKRIHPFVDIILSQASEDEIIYCSQNMTPVKKKRDSSFEYESDDTVSNSSFSTESPRTPPRTSKIFLISPPNIKKSKIKKFNKNIKKQTNDICKNLFKEKIED